MIIRIGRVHRVAAGRVGSRVGSRVDYLMRLRLRRRWMVRMDVGMQRRKRIRGHHVTRRYRLRRAVMCGDWLPIEAVHVDEVCRERVHTRHMRRRSVRHERRRRRLVRRVLDVGGGLQARVVGALLRLVRLVIALLLLAFLLPLLAKVVLVREDLCARREWSGEAEKV